MPRGCADWHWFPPAATSNRAFGSPEHGSPTSFTGRRARAGHGSFLRVGGG